MMSMVDRYHSLYRYDSCMEFSLHCRCYKDVHDVQVHGIYVSVVYTYCTSICILIEIYLHRLCKTVNMFMIDKCMEYMYVWYTRAVYVYRIIEL